MLSVCSDKDTKKQLKYLLEEKASSVGLLVCRRFVNFPYELVPKLYDALFDEVSWATEDEVIFCSEIPFFVCFSSDNELATLFAPLKPTKELRDSFRFKHYLLVVRILEVRNILRF